MLRNRNELDGLPKQAFAQGFAGQSSGPRLTRSPNLGLSVEQIARYFSVDLVEVRASLNPIGSHWAGMTRVRPAPGVRLRFLPVGQLVDVTRMATMASLKASIRP